jgi:serine/threonine protein kinase
VSREASNSSGHRQPSERWAELVNAVNDVAKARERDPKIPGVKLGRFELLEYLGGGGMGVVFRARDPKLDREVALKLWKLPREEAETAVLHEAQCLAKLSHPNVVAVYETGKVGDDVFLTMELVDGMDGREWVRRFFPSWKQVLDLGLAVGRGLAAAHAAGLEHGDFKPENILIGGDRRARVADFGLARALREHVTVDDDLLAGEDSVGGTPEYMAPERHQGRRGDARSDQFSFCVMLWEILYGTLPFEGATGAEQLEAIKTGEPSEGPTVLGIPQRLRRAVLRGLSVRPEDRWPDMRSLLDELDEIRQLPEVRKRRRRVAAVVVGVAVGSSVATGLVLALHAPQEFSSQDGINPEPATTLPLDDDLPGPEGDLPGPEDDLPVEGPDRLRGDALVRDIIDKIDAGELEAAQTRWNEAERLAWETGTSVGWESLEIARAFADEFAELEHTAPTRAILAARVAASAAGYARAHFPATSDPGVEAAEILKRIVPLSTHANRLLADFTRLSNSTATIACSCGPDEGGLHSCELARGAVGADEHRCLSGVLSDHEDAVQFLDCVVPSLKALESCLTSGDCKPAAVTLCDLKFDDQLAACPEPAGTVRERLDDCTR